MRSGKELCIKYQNTLRYKVAIDKTFTSMYQESRFFLTTALNLAQPIKPNYFKKQLHNSVFAIFLSSRPYYN